MSPSHSPIQPPAPTRPNRAGNSALTAVQHSDHDQGSRTSDQQYRGPVSRARDLPETTEQLPPDGSPVPIQPLALLGEGDALARAQAGDHQAFAQIYSLHKRRIYSLCLRMVGNGAEAEDLTQEAFLQLYRKIGTFRGDSAFSTWLHRLAVNVVLMQLRKKGLPLISLDDAMEPAPEEGPGRAFGAHDLTLSGAIDRLALERAVAALPAGYRLIFILHDVEGFEHNEIASMLDCSIGNSKSQLHKARLKLRDALRKQTSKEAQA